MLLSKVFSTYLFMFLQIYDYAQYYLDLADANRKVAEASPNDDSGMDSSNR